MQNRGAERTAKLLLVVVFLLLGIISILYLMKRSETFALLEEIEIKKSEARDVEDSLRMKISALEQKLEPLQTQLKQLGKCEDQLISNDKEIDQKDTNLRQCKADLEEANQAKTETMSQLKLERDKATDHSSSVKDLTEQLSVAQGSVQACETLVSKLRRENDVTQTTLQSTKQDLAQCNARCQSNNNIQQPQQQLQQQQQPQQPIEPQALPGRGGAGFGDDKPVLGEGRENREKEM